MARGDEVELNVVEAGGVRYLEGRPGEALLRRPGEATRLVEQCFNHQVSRVLLYAENFTERFFDLSSGEAGEILQKLRNYHIRLAAVLMPGQLQLSRHFPELMVEEQRNSYFRIYASRALAEYWLISLGEA